MVNSLPSARIWYTTRKNEPIRCPRALRSVENGSSRLAISNPAVYDAGDRSRGLSYVFAPAGT